jgi:hypothetical protein
MSDDSDRAAGVPIDALGLLRAAAEPARYRLLTEAIASGKVATEHAARVAGVDPSTGTAVYHLRALVAKGLFVRRAHGEYEPTPLGRAVASHLKQFVEDLGTLPESTVSRSPT